MKSKTSARVRSLSVEEAKKEKPKVLETSMNRINDSDNFLLFTLEDIGNNKMNGGITIFGNSVMLITELVKTITKSPELLPIFSQALLETVMSGMTNIEKDFEENSDNE